MKKISLGVSIMPEKEFLKSTLPLFENGDVDAIEWSFDTIENIEYEPQWMSGLLDAFGKENKLLGHGVYYSLFDAKWTNRQDLWLKRLKEATERHNYTHLTEHFGFMSSENYHKGFPLPLSLNNATLKIGIDRLKRLQDTVKIPVGIENLAFSFSEQDVIEQGEFIAKMIHEVGGFIILDLHNIYCQAHNFDKDLFDIINSYPLDEVKEIHISGGSWQQSIYQKNRKIRRDTHDGAVPKGIFEVLPDVIAKCKNLEFIILERLGNTFI